MAARLRRPVAVSGVVRRALVAMLVVCYRVGARKKALLNSGVIDRQARCDAMRCLMIDCGYNAWLPCVSSSCKQLNCLFRASFCSLDTPVKSSIQHLHSAMIYELKELAHAGHDRISLFLPLIQTAESAFNGSTLQPHTIFHFGAILLRGLARGFCSSCVNAWRTCQKLFHVTPFLPCITYCLSDPLIFPQHTVVKPRRGTLQ